MIKTTKNRTVCLLNCVKGVEKRVMNQIFNRIFIVSGQVKLRLDHLYQLN